MSRFEEHLRHDVLPDPEKSYSLTASCD